MQKGEWLPFSRLFSFCILHSAFCIHPLGAGELSSRRFRGASSSEPDPLQTRFQFLAAWDMLVRFGID